MFSCDHFAPKLIERVLNMGKIPTGLALVRPKRSENSDRIFQREVESLNRQGIIQMLEASLCFDIHTED